VRSPHAKVGYRQGSLFPPLLPVLSVLNVSFFRFQLNSELKISCNVNNLVLEYPCL